MLSNLSWNTCIFPCILPKLIWIFTTNNKATHQALLWIIPNVIASTLTCFLQLLLLLYWMITEHVTDTICHTCFAKKNFCNHKEGWGVVLSRVVWYLQKMVSPNLVGCQNQSTVWPYLFGIFCGHHFLRNIHSFQSGLSSLSA